MKTEKSLFVAPSCVSGGWLTSLLLDGVVFVLSGCKLAEITSSFSDTVRGQKLSKRQR